MGTPKLRVCERRVTVWILGSFHDGDTWLAPHAVRFMTDQSFIWNFVLGKIEQTMFHDCLLGCGSFATLFITPWSTLARFHGMARCWGLTGRCHLHRHPHRWPNTARAAYPTGRSPSARARQAGTRICQDEEVLRDSPVLARLVKRSPNELLCGTSIISFN
jgi:hypothetical protein